MAAENRSRQTILSTPFNIMLFDNFVHESLTKARRTYNTMFPDLACQNKDATNDELIAATVCAERFLNNFSLIFGVHTSDGIYLHNRYKDREQPTSIPISFCAEVFCQLSNLMDHPAYQMLRLVHSVVYERNRSYASLRDIRWIFKPEHAGLTVVGILELFSDLTHMLREFAEQAASSVVRQTTKATKEAFDTYVLDDKGNIVINDVTFGVATSLAIAVYESCSNRTRPIQ